MTTPSTHISPQGWGTRVLSHVGGMPTVKKIGGDAGVAGLFMIGGWLTRDDGPLKDASPATKRMVNAVFGSPMLAMLTVPELIEKWQEIKKSGGKKGIPDFVMHGLTATIATLGISTNDRDIITSAAMLATLFSMAGHLEEGVESVSMKGVEALEQSIPKRALRCLREDDRYKFTLDGHHMVEDIDAAEVKIGDHLLVKHGEVVPVDGKALSFHRDGQKYDLGALNTLAVSGENGVHTISEGSPVKQGAISGDHKNIVMEAKMERAESGMMQELEMLKKAEETPARSVHMINNGIGKIYVPIMMAACAAQFALTYHDTHKRHIQRRKDLAGAKNQEEKEKLPQAQGQKHHMQKAVKRTAELAIKMAPCAILASTLVIPFVKNALAASHGILVHEDVVFEKISKVTHVLMDLRGTASTSRMTKFTGMHIWENGKLVQRTENNLLAMLGKAQNASNHDIAECTRIAAIEAKQDIKLIKGIETAEAVGNQGVKASLKDGHNITMGTRDMMYDLGHAVPDELQLATQKHGDVTFFRHEHEGNVRWGANSYKDEPRKGTPEGLKALIDKGVNVQFATGMPEASARSMLQEMNIPLDKVKLHANCTPVQKARIAEELCSNPKNVVLAAGDGLNDRTLLSVTKQKGGLAFAIKSTGVPETKAASSAIIEGIHQIPGLMTLSKRMTHALWLNVTAAASWMTLLVGAHCFGHEMKTQDASIAHEAPTFLLTLGSLAQSIHLVKGLGAVR